MEEGEKKFIGRKRLFEVVRNKNSDEEEKIKQDDKKDQKTTANNRNNITASKSTPKNEGNNHLSQNNNSNSSGSQINYNNSFNNDNVIKIEKSIDIVSESVNWKDKSNITFDKIIKKYLSLNTNSNKKNNISLDLDNFLSNIIEDKEFIFKLIFTDSANVINYSYPDVKNTNIQAIEKKHNGKIKKIFIEVLDKRDYSELTKNLDDEKLEKYRKHFKNLLDQSSENLDDSSMVNLFFEEFPTYWDNFENIAIQTLSDKYQFQDLSAYVYLYLYDNLKKLKDPKLVESLKNKLKECVNLPKDLSYFTKEMILFYSKRQEKMKNNLSKNIKDLKWQEDNSFTEIFLSTFIYIKFQAATEIDLTQHYIMNDNILTVFSALKMIKTVNKLILNSNKIGEEGMWQLSRVLLYNKSLTDVDLSMNLLTDDAIKAFTLGLIDGYNYDSFNLNTNLITPTFPLIKLNLSNNNSLTHECGKYIAKIILLSPQLRSLNLSKNSIEDKGFIPIAQVIKKLTLEKKSNLETLILFQTKLGPDTILLFSEILASPYCTLKSITMSDNKLCPKSTVELFKSIAVNKSLEELLLMNCDIGNEIAEQIYHMMLSNNSLINLNVYNNKIDSPQVFKNILKIFKNKPNEKISNNNYISTHNDFNFLSDDVCDQFFCISGNTQIENIYDLKDVQTSINNNNFLGSQIKNNNFENITSAVFASGNTNYPNQTQSVEDYHATNKSTNYQSLETCNINGNKNTSKIKYLDLSKNKCKLTIDNELIDILEHLELESLDISQNFDFPTNDENMSKKFKEAIVKIQEKTKIIY